MDRTIPLYTHDGAIIDLIDQARLGRLLNMGRVARVVHSRNGKVRRAVLHRMPGEPRPTFLVNYLGTRYCYRQHLEHGNRCFRLRSLGDPRADDHNLAPSSVRPIFMRVLLDCGAFNPTERTARLDQGSRGRTSDKALGGPTPIGMDSHNTDT